MRTNEASLIQPVVAGVFAVSSGRLGSSVAILLGLTAVVVGGLALTRAAGRRSPRAVDTVDRFGGATVAMALGLIGAALGGLVAATAEPGVGTGNGFAGAV